MLHPRPALRPSVSRIRAHPFFLTPDDDDGGDRGSSSGDRVSSSGSKDGESIRDGINGEGGTTTGGFNIDHPPRTKDSKIIRLFGEVPQYDVYFSYRRSCPSDKVIRARATPLPSRQCLYMTHPSHTNPQTLLSLAPPTR